MNDPLISESGSEVRTRLQFQGAVIERVTLNGQELEVVFASIPTVLVRDPFGFDFDPLGICGCTITIRNPQYEFLPQAGRVTDGHIALGELCYISLFPGDLSLDCACFLMIEQPISNSNDGARSDEEDGADSESEAEDGADSENEAETETFMIVGSELRVITVENNI